MGQIIKFFGFLVMGIAVTLVIFGHIMIPLVYDMDYLVDTLWPKDPNAYSSIWVAMASLFPGGMLWGIGWGLERFDIANKDRVSTENEDVQEASPDAAGKVQKDIQTESLK